MYVVKRIGKQALCIMLSMMMVWSLIPGLSYSLVYAEDGGAPAQSQAVEENVDKSDKASETKATSEPAEEAEAKEEKAEAKEEKEPPKAEEPKEEPKAEEPAEEPKAEEPAEEPEAAAEEESVKDSGDEPKEEAASEDVSEDTEEAEEDVSEETEEAGAYGGKYSKDLKTVAVDVETAEDAFKEEVKLVVKPLDEDSDEYADAEKALEKNKQTYAGMLAFDIHFENAKGKEIEPSGPVSVTMNAKKEALKDIPVDFFDAESVQFTHIGEKATEVVADITDETDGTVDVSIGTKAVKSIEGTFEVESFSTFTLTWGTNQSATIHYGKIENGQFVEIAKEETVTLDTTADTISLNTNIDGYSFIGAAYKANSSASGVDIEPAMLTKTNNGWQITTVDRTDEDNPVTSTVTVANGSDIYVYYGEKQSHGSSPSDVEGPITTKVVSDNEDGTYNITIDVETPVKTQTTQKGANVLVVLDRTYSMRNAMTSSKSRWEVAQGAVSTLVDALDCDTNDIDLALVTFYRIGEYHKVWNGTHWTKDGEAFDSRVQGLSANSNTSQYGTNWESGLYYANQVLDDRPDNDPTYVIFLTDGEPNRRGTTTYQNASTSDAISYALLQAQDITARSNVSLYGIFCGSDSGHDNLANMISTAGGVQTINGTSESAIQQAFSGIAETIVNNLGSSNVSVDDGVTTLSSISSAVAGEAGGYEYYISYKLTVNGNSGTYTDMNKQSHTVSLSDDGVWTKTVDGETVYYYKEKWNDAPGATYSSDNGVTWDLSSKGTLPKDTIFTIEFNVWPSQEAYDLIADLNNGVVQYSSLDNNTKAQIGGSLASGYYMLTNTHLKTTYTYSGETYTDDSGWNIEHMPLPTEIVKVKKIWNNPVDAHIGDDSGNGVDLYLTKDGKNYLYGANAIKVAPKSEGDLVWESTKDIYISCGQMEQEGNSYKILETGHDYSIAEPEAFAYYWNLTADIYHPMVINGKDVMLIRDDKATGTDGVDFYTIGGHKYIRHSADTEDNVSYLEATNDRRSTLNLTKKISDSSYEPDVSEDAFDDELFEYTITINNANAKNGNKDNLNSDYYVWFSVYDPKAGESGDLVKDLTTSATPETGNTGYYYVASGSPFTVELKPGWNLRVLNLPNETTYSIIESARNGFEFDGAVGSAWSYENGGASEVYTPTVTAAQAKVEGSIPKSNRDYTVTYTNKVTYDETDEVNKPAFEILKKDIDGTVLQGATFTLTDSAGTTVWSGTTDSEGKASVNFDKFNFSTTSAKAEYTFTLTETPPTGYQSEGPWTIKVGEDGDVVDVVEDEDTGVWQRVWNWIIELFAKQNQTTDTSEWDGENLTLEVKNTPTTQNVSVEKVWKDSDPSARPQSINVTLLADGKEVKQDGITATQTLSAENSWKYTWEGLYTTKGGKDIAYTVQEDVSVEGYATGYSGNETTGFIITNSNVTLDTEAGFFKKTVLKGSENKENTAKFNFTAVQVADETGAPMTSGTPWTGSGSVEYAKGESGVKNVNFGTITYSKADTYYYKVTEATPPDGWTATASAPKTSDEGAIVKVIVTGNANDGFKVEVVDNTITNKYSVSPEKISFPVKKVLDVPKGLTPASIEGKFTFTLTAGENTAEGEIATPMPEVTEYKNPDADGGTVTFGDITYTAPGTYTYTVTETGEVDGVTNDTANPKIVTVTVVDNGDGTLTVTASSTENNPLTFTNEYKVKPVTAKFPVKKILQVEEGLTPPDITEKYTFTLAAGENTSAGKVETPMPEVTAYKNPDKDGGTVTFGDITYTEPGIYTYTVTESGTVTGVANDSAAAAGKTVTVTVKDNGDGTLKATPSVTTNNPLEFTNTYSVKKVGATIPVEKILEVPDGLKAPDITKKYTFTLTAVGGAPLVDLDGNPIETELQNQSATGGEMSFGVIAFTKPGTYTYTVAEAGDVDGVTNDTANPKTVTVEVSDNSDGTMTAVVNGGKKVQFTNTYGVDPTTVKFPVKKVLDVPKGLTPDSIADKFTFTLTGGENTAVGGIATPMPKETEKKNPDADGGTVTFGDIEYTKPGTYNYTVTETGDVDGITNDTDNPKTVTVTVVDNGDGTLTATASSTEDKPLTFTNEYKVEPTTVKFPVEKSIKAKDGLTPPDITEEYTFTLEAGENTSAGKVETPMPEVTEYKNPDADGGTVTFGDITYTEPGTYTYTVTEAGEVDGITNDTDNPKTVTVTVKDNGDGTLTATASSTEDKPLTFTNEYKVKPTTVKFPVEKSIKAKEGLTPPDITEEYTFTLEAGENTSAGKVETPMPEVTEYKNPDADGGTVTFGDITYTEPGTYTYTVTEAGEVDGITNDTDNPKTVTVTVVDNKDGTLTATASSTEDKPLTFTNEYKVKPTTVKFPVEKSIKAKEGLTPPDITEEYTFTLAAGENTSAGKVETPMPEKTEYKNPDADGGTVTFGDITYTEPGTYTYTVTEAGEVDGITNDTDNPKTVTVTVVDNKDGTLTATASSTEDKPLTFTNEYKVEPTTTKAKVKKTVTAVDPAAESTTFSFELKAGTNTSAGGVDTPMPKETKVEATFTEAGDQVVYFDEMEFKEPGVYNYTITEDVDSLPSGWVVTGSPADIMITVTDNSDGTLTAVVSNSTITNEYPTKKVEGVKTWNDADYFDEDGNPLNGYERKDITIKLLADGEETGKTVTLKAEDFKDLAPTEPWPFSFTDLPATADHGKTEIEYTVVEVTPEGWTSEVDDYEVINTPIDKEEVLNPIDLTIKKIDGTTDTGKGLEGAVFTLFDAEGVGVGSYTTDKNGEIVVPFTQSGNSVGTYTLRETKAPTGYEPITDEYKVVVEKDFVKVTFNKEKTVWQWIYDMVFGEESDFDAKTKTLTIPNTPKKVEVTATKIWNDASNKDKVRPDEVTFQLYKTVNGVESIMEGKTVTLSGDGDTWTDKITDLWEYEDGYKIKYTFKELDASGNVVADGGILPGKDGAEYTAAYQEDGVTIRNSYQVSPDKDVTKSNVSIDGQPVQGGDTLTYTISYINTSGKTANEVVIKDTPPMYTKFVTGSNKVVEGPDAASFDAGSELVWTFKDVPDGTAITVSFDVTVDEKDAAGNTLVNKASVNGKDTNEVINSVPKKEVFDSKTETFIDGEPVKIGQILTYKITYKNVTGEQAEVVITDKIPELTEYVPDSADNKGSESGGTITWNLTLEKDEEITVSFKVKVSDDVNGEILENTGKVKDAENKFEVDTNTTTNPTPRKLKIIKNLADFVDHGEYVEASFAFEIRGKDENGKEVYYNTIGMDFSAGKMYDEVIVKGIPSKAVTVTVEEIYDGNYKPDETGAVKVSEVDGVYQVTFNNTKSDIEYKGGVTNHYGKDGDTYKYQPEQLVQ